MGSDLSKIARARGDRASLEALLPGIDRMGIGHSSALVSCLLELGVVVDRRPFSARTLANTIGAVKVAGVGEEVDVARRAFAVFARRGAVLNYLEDDGRWVCDEEKSMLAIYRAAVRSPDAAGLLEAYAAAHPAYGGALPFAYLADAHLAGLDHAAVAYAYASLIRRVCREFGPPVGINHVADRAATCDRRGCDHCAAIFGGYRAAHEGAWWDGPPLLAHEKAAVRDDAGAVVARFGCDHAYAVRYCHLIRAHAASAWPPAAPPARLDPPPYENPVGK